MNAMSKNRLQLFFSGNGPRVGNRQRGSTRLGLVDRRPKNSFDKARLNILRAEDIRYVGARLSTKRDDKISIEGDDKAGTGGDNEVGIGGNNKPGTGGPDNEPGIGRLDDEPGIRGQDNKLSTGGQDGDGVGYLGRDNGAGTRGRGDKRVAKPTARAFHIEE